MLRSGGRIPNPLVSAFEGTPVRLGTILAGCTAVLTARQPGAELAGYCRRHGLVLVRISGMGTARPSAAPDAGWIGARLAGAGRPPCGP